MDLFIPLILGTAREGRRSERAARFVFEKLKATPGIRTEFLDVRDFRLSATDDREETPMVKKYREIVARADGLVIVAPEYNHGIPGELKMMLDMAFEEYARKPIAICGVASGGMGGVRMVEQLRLIAIELHMMPIATAVYFSNIKTLFDADGHITDPAVEPRVEKLIAELMWHAQVLKQGRET